MFKSHIYKIVWAYQNPYTYSYTELVKARNPVSAWKKITRKHFSYIHLVELTEVL